MYPSREVWSHPPGHPIDVYLRHILKPPVLWNLGKKGIDVPICRAGREMQTEKEPVDTVGKGEGGMN